ncbi:hypothetical protein [Nocardioides sp. SYSU D00065]|uniref:hypothetical protein n=1 Tax=Nocardioides sp. SYSU D00065 TaxID=2817378 RepID=UPI001B336A24|nr:hypothetical protein [Nocardioides sp. SYSU D00065]
MTNDLDTGLLTVLGVLAGIAALLFLLAAMDPTNLRRPKPAHRAARTRVDS